MNSMFRNSALAQRVLGGIPMLSSSSSTLGGGGVVVENLLLSLHQRFSSDATTGGSGVGAESEAAVTPPKKRRGRPPKKAAMVAVEETKEEEAPAAVEQQSTKAMMSSTTTTSAPPSPPKQRQRPPRERLIQGLATVTSPLSLRDPSSWHSGSSLADLVSSSTSTTAPPLGFYLDIPSNLVPEAEAAFYYDPLLTEERVKQPHYGCKAATAAFESAGARALLHRPAIASLLDTVLSRQYSRIQVDGWAGSGKSIALYALAAAARASGMVVMYIPTATLMTQGGRFYRSDDEDDPLWDTPEAARHIMNAVMGAHGDELINIKTVDGKSTLAEVVKAGLASSSAQATVEAAIALKDGLLHHDKGLVIVDDYNALYSHTAYHEPMHEFYRRPIAADELRLASAFRVLEAESGQGIAVVSACYGASVSPALRLPRAAGTHTLRVPRYDLNEVSAFAAMSVANGNLPQMPDEMILKRALALTNGNAKELRDMQSTLLLAQGPLGISLGYKAHAVAKKQYSLTLDN